MKVTCTNCEVVASRVFYCQDVKSLNCKKSSNWYFVNLGQLLKRFQLEIGVLKFKECENDATQRRYLKMVQTIKGIQVLHLSLFGAAFPKWLVATWHRASKAKCPDTL